MSVISCFLFLASCFFVSPVASLVSERGERGAVTFYYSLSRFPVEDSVRGMTRLDVRVAVANDEPIFVAYGDSFQVSYEISVVLSSKKRQVAAKSWRRMVTVERYEETTSKRDFDLSMVSLAVGPGRYRLLVQVVDLESRKRSWGSVDVDIPSSDTPQDVQMSDILLVRSVGPTFDPISDAVIPELRETGESRHDLSAYVEILLPPSERFGEISWTISDIKGKPLLSDTSELQSDIRLVKKMFSLSSMLEAGRYLLKVSFKVGGREVETVREFSLPGKGTFLAEDALFRAVEQLVYIAGSDTVERMKRLPYQPQQEAFDAFWTKLDPTPQTEENELMEEYYTRAVFADRYFSSLSLRGWRTDRGGIYMLYGPPDRIEDYPPDARFRGPYQVWRYDELARTFTFADLSGFGHYSLVLSN
ncbi:MAG: GWxTD domain-containing protein [Candidatus Latescibacteria bacterium]|nr:GWxTD domain-containing protein [Candidatus Latescibacterota bacterium]